MCSSDLGACAAAGMVIGGITMTGLAGKVSELLTLIAGANLALTLIFAAVMTIILGMGMPTPAAYALSAALVGPTLVGDFGIAPMQAHLFLLYFSVLSAMTPPVAVAAYAAAGIADSQPVGLAVSACKLAVAAFLLPFAFIYGPGLLLMNEPLWIVAAIVSTTAAVILLSVAAEGYWRRPIGWPVRLVMLAAALFLLAPQVVPMAIGTALGAAALTMLALGVGRPRGAEASAPATDGGA